MLYNIYLLGKYLYTDRVFHNGNPKDVLKVISKFTENAWAEYPEKTVIAYLRKLSRLFKNLDHGFGAASGYSMIMDAIKTFDDAVNEATIEMRNNKDSN